MGVSKVRKVGNMILGRQVIQKVHQLGQLFGRVLRHQTYRGTCRAMPLFRAQKSKMVNKDKDRYLLTPIDR